MVVVNSDIGPGLPGKKDLLIGEDQYQGRRLE
jgi:hypothetical protein